GRGVRSRRGGRGWTAPRGSASAGGAFDAAGITELGRVDGCPDRRVVGRLATERRPSHGAGLRVGVTQVAWAGDRTGGVGVCRSARPLVVGLVGVRGAR